MYHMLKKIVPDIQVGVFLPFSFKDEKTSNSHKWLLTEGDSVDFIGYHSNQNDVVDFQELNDDRFFMTKDYLKEKTAKMKNYLKKHGIEKPLHLISLEYTFRKHTLYKWYVFPWGFSVKKCFRHRR